MKQDLFFILLSLSVITYSCSEKKAATLFTLEKNSGIRFTNTVENKKDFNIFSYRNFYNGGGVAIGDINNDGLPDVLMTSNTGANKLFLNKGNFQFEDISAKAGIEEKGKWNTGVVMADINSDGWLDIYICNAGYDKWKNEDGNALFINNRDLTFTNKAAEYGLNEKGYTTHAAFFDYDLDGDLDCYILNNSFIPVNTLNYANKRDLRAEDWPVAEFLKGGGDKLLRNDGPPVATPQGVRKGGFVDVSKEANIFGSLIGFGLGVTVGDINKDGYPDLYISNDFFERDYLYINQQDGTFKEELEQWVQHSSLASMGADIADINNDSYPDIFTTDMLPDDEVRLKTTASFENIDVYNLKLDLGFYHQFMQNTLQVNGRNGRFLESGFFSGVAASDWSWGALIFDADNDGLSDIYVCNGIYHDVTDQDFIDFFADEIIQKMVLTGEKEEVEKVINKMPSTPIANKFFRNNGKLKFSDEGLVAGFTEKSFSNGAAYGDLDNDGDLDLVVNNVNQEAFVYRNNSVENNGSYYIGFSLKGKGDNLFAVGSTVRIFNKDQVITRELIPSRGFQSSVDYKIVAGIGYASEIDSAIITWPDRSNTVIHKPAINQVHPVSQQGGAILDFTRQRNSTTLLTPLLSDFEKHNEDKYIDFYQERNIPMMLSREGPQAAHADVNGDGLEDIYICGAAGQAGQLYLQTTAGKFIESAVPAFQHTASFEDVTALFFDCDNDGDMDLFVGSGGNHLEAGSRELQNRLYRNNGNGKFERDSLALPRSGFNCGVALAHDFDVDGDMDLFVGSQSVPQNYGMIPFSYLLENDGKGKFTDIAFKQNRELATAGMITGAVWTDVTGDQKKELIVVGEWMAPRIFSIAKNKIEELSASLAEVSGWWRTVKAADLDGDGDDDLVLGNIGGNCYLQADEARPLKFWVRDFDGNGAPDKFMTRTVAGKDMPVFMKRDVTDQLPVLKKQNLKHRDYAQKSIQDLFPANMLNQSQPQLINYTSTCIAINEGNGRFTIHELPVMVQLSSVNSVLCTDINNDGTIDLVMGGNEFGFQPQFSRLDASYGHVLLNDGKAGFTWLPPDRSGLDLRGQVRDIIEIRSGDQKDILFLQNNEKPVLYRVQKNSDLKMTANAAH